MIKLKIYQIPTSVFNNTSLPIVIVNDNIFVDPTYIDITNIENFEKYCENQFVRKEQIKILLGEIGWENLNNNEKKLVSKYFLVNKELRDLVLTEQEQSQYNYYKIYDFITEDQQENVNVFDPPHSIDYKIGLKQKLHPEYIINDAGFLVECTHYSDINVTIDSMEIEHIQYNNPILKYTAEYYIGTNGLVNKRIVKRQWYLLDGSLGEEKISEKIYTGIKSRDESKRRRQNIIDKLIGQTLGYIIFTSSDISTVTEAEIDSRGFIKEVSTGIQDYIEFGIMSNTPENPNLLITQITESLYSRLENFIAPDFSLREYLLNKLNYNLNNINL
jgi:hypothetical protein